MQLDFVNRELTVKLVYYGPALSGKTTNLQALHKAAEPGASGRLMTLETRDDRTLFFDLLPLTFRNQGAWLTEIARDWLISLENQPDMAALRQFQTLTHPAHLGGSFHVLELSWNQGEAELSATDRHRLALQACPAPPSR